MDQFNDFLCFRLSSLSRRIIRYYNNRLADLGITLGQAFVLFSLLKNDGSSVKQIAAAVQLDSSAVTGLVDRLTKERLVERQEDPEDRRSIQVFLTANGRQVAIRALAIAQEFNLHMAGKQDLEMLAQWEQRLEDLEHLQTRD